MKESFEKLVESADTFLSKIPSEYHRLNELTREFQLQIYDIQREMERLNLTET